MARQRPAARPAPRAAPKAPAQQTRPSHTMAAPPPAMAPPPPTTQAQGPGLFGQMASTAAGVAIGSSIGHAVGNLFAGGASEPAAAPQAAAPPATPQNLEGLDCKQAGDLFMQCMNNNVNNADACRHYLDLLKGCRS